MIKNSIDEHDGTQQDDDVVHCQPSQMVCHKAVKVTAVLSTIKGSTVHAQQVAL